MDGHHLKYERVPAVTTHWHAEQFNGYDYSVPAIADILPRGSRFRTESRGNDFHAPLKRLFISFPRCGEISIPEGSWVLVSVSGGSWRVMSDKEFTRDYQVARVSFDG